MDALAHYIRALGERDEGAVSKEQAKLISGHLGVLRKLSKKLGLTTTENRVNFLEGKLMFGNAINRDVAASLDELLKALRLEVCRIQFAYIAASKVGYFEQHDLF